MSAYPDNFSASAFAAAMRNAPEPPTPRELTADERTVIDRVRAVQAALLALRHAPHVSDPGTDAAEQRDGLLVDCDWHCAGLITAIEAQPQDEADREEIDRMNEGEY